LYDSIRYLDTDNSVLDTPSGVTVTAESSAAALDMYNNHTEAFNTILDLDTPMTSDYQFVVVVQAKDQGESN
jgi:hypothetical protein